MDQHTRGLHSVLSAPWVYRTYQRAIGARRLHREVVSTLGAQEGDRVLDIGCGPADIRAHLPDVEYVGFDLSKRYIASARRRHGARGRFFVADVTEVDMGEFGVFDRVVAHGIVHHVNDARATELFALASRVLTAQGCLVTVDGCYHDDQGRVSRFLVSRDRGRMVRTAPEYRALAEGSFAQVDVRLERSLLRIPYSLAILRCSRPRMPAVAEGIPGTTPASGRVRERTVR